MVIFWLVQASALLVFAVPFAWPLVGLWAVSHFLRAIGLTLRSTATSRTARFKMNRVARFVWAFIGTAAMQKGPLWWAGHHVNHHRFADRDGDPHSPTVSGFYYAHIGWFLNDAKHDRARAEQPGRSAISRRRRRSRCSSASTSCRRSCSPLAMYLDRRAAVAGLGLLPADDDARARDVRDQHRQPHVRIAPVRDASTSRATTPFTAFFAVGEGWHNNHHRYQRAARNGFYWWEFDPDAGTRSARWPALGLAWDMQPVPERIYDEARAVKAQPRRATVPSVVDADAARARRRARLTQGRSPHDPVGCVLCALSVLSDSYVRDERQVIGRDQRRAASAAARRRRSRPARRSRCDRGAGPGRGPGRCARRLAQVVAQIDAVQLLAQQRRRQPAHPLVEVAEHELRPGDVPVGDDRASRCAWCRRSRIAVPRWTL